MAKQVEEPKMKKYVAKKKEGDFSLYSNLSDKAPAGTQTISKKKLIRGILHGVGIGQRVELGNPIHTLDANIDLHIAEMKRNKVDMEIIHSVKQQSKSNNYVMV